MFRYRAPSSASTVVLCSPLSAIRRAIAEKQYSTLDNTDIVSHVFGAFDDLLVVDMKIHYNATQNFSFDFGIDNIFNEQYFLFHPFPGRTFVLAAKYTL
jgi:iron complex outermembrane receptor protein